MYALSCACKLITRRIVRTYIYYIIPVSGSRFLVQLAGPTLSLLFGGHCRSRTLRALTSLSLQSNFSIPAPVLQAPSSNIKYNALVPRFLPCLNPVLHFHFRVVPGKTALENLHVIRTQRFPGEAGKFRIFPGRGNF